MELIGEKLKKIRLEKGLTLEEAHKKTKIHLNVLKAIEEGSVVNLSPVYLKGFIKIYCKFLGVDSKDYVLDYKESQISSKYTHAAQNQPKPVSFIQSASAKMGSLNHPKKIQTIIIVILGVIFLMAMFALGKVVALKRGAAQKKTKAARITAVKPPRKTDPVKAQKPAVADFTFKPTISSAGSGVKLTISAREDCWIKVKSDGKLLYYGILKKGRFDSWQAKDKINLFLGNAGVVDLNANGQVITNLGRKGQVLGDIVITKEGLSVR